MMFKLFIVQSMGCVEEYEQWTITSQNPILFTENTLTDMKEHDRTTSSTALSFIAP